MGDRDPLDDWLMFSNLSEFNRSHLAEQRAQAAKGLDKLGAYLENEPGKSKRNVAYDTGLTRWLAAPLPPQELPRAQQFYLALVERGGTGSSHVQEGLLNMIGWAREPDSLPFWQQVLEINRPRDTFANTRRQYALAAIALLAIKGDEPRAYEALRTAARHANENVRGPAVYYLARAYRDAERQFPEEVVALLSEIALYDKAFIPRFHAREALRAAGLAVPRDNPGGAYAFKVRFRGDKTMHRVIEVRSEQTLEDLHLAIQRALKWDNDHLYSFFLNNELYDERFGFASPFDSDAPRQTSEGVIGELGLMKGHKFLYFFDYGDSHEFEVEVVAIEPKATAKGYPRVIESKGKAPKQYHYGW